ncbi:MAG: calcium-translocating P-type ATPase, PMCA-type [Clostridiaceae bacterium]|nr:calcium-translocating P-type ATPase, PMCA-type [Clostridiaceae bacterium]
MWHNLEAEEVIRQLETDKDYGLSTEEAQKRYEKYGPNALEEEKKKSIIVRFLLQFKDFMVIILLIAAAVSAIASGGEELLDSIIILAIVVINAVLGLIQESKAEQALEALKKMSAPHAKVLRDGKVAQIETSKLVVGDIIFLEAGDFVPADGRIIECANLKAEESALTGESVPVEKSNAKIDKEDVPIGDRFNMVISSSNITYGRCKAVVTATGMDTEVGKIAGMIMEEDSTKTPLAQKLDQIGKVLGTVALAICAVMFGLGIMWGKEPLDMFMTSVSLAVAAIPEGLPAIVTIVLAMGVSKMVKRNAIIRKLPAVETLGSASVICSDKTGTLTQNKMTVVKIEAFGNDENTAISLFSLCNDARVEKRGDGFVSFGDPTETAMVEKAARMGILKDELERKMPRVAEVPFDSERKLMSTIHKTEKGFRIITKGAPDIMLQKSIKVNYNGKEVEKSEELIKLINDANENMAKDALRVLAAGYRDIETLPDKIDAQTIEKDLVFYALVGMIDPPREEVKDAVKLCKDAGIRPVMITGDHITTAVAIAKELGISSGSDKAMLGSDLDKLSDEEFEKVIEDYSVFARVSPENKVRIVKAWQKRGKIVAMTGDGVNDAPALKIADIGCAMGITGTDVAKGTADMVLTDDNFATIVAAVEEGRGVYSNIKKAIHFLLSCNIGEIVTLFIATILNFAQMPLIPIQLLWVNLITDSLPALALGVESIDKDIMKKPPRDPKKGVFADGLAVTICWQGFMVGLITLAAYVIGDMYYGDHLEANTMAFAVLALSQLFHAFNVRSEKSLFKTGVFSNLPMIGAFLVSFVLQCAVLFVPFLQKVFGVTTLSYVEYLIVFGLSVSPIVICEIVKLIKNGAKRK